MSPLRSARISCSRPCVVFAPTCPTEYMIGSIRTYADTSLSRCVYTTAVPHLSVPGEVRAEQLQAHVKQGAHARRGYNVGAVHV